MKWPWQKTVIADIKRLEVGPDDVIVIEPVFPITLETADIIRKEVLRFLPNAKVMVLSEAKLNVIHTKATK